MNPEEHGDTHYCNASVIIAIQLCAYYPEEVILMSSDNKMKIGIEIPTVSRRLKIHTYSTMNAIERGSPYITSLLAAVMLQLELLGKVDQLTDQQILTLSRSTKKI